MLLLVGNRGPTVVQRIHRCLTRTLPNRRVGVFDAGHMGPVTHADDHAFRLLDTGAHGHALHQNGQYLLRGTAHPGADDHKLIGHEGAVWCVTDVGGKVTSASVTVPVAASRTGRPAMWSVPAKLVPLLFVTSTVNCKPIWLMAG